MPQIEITIDENGETAMKITGIKGKACQPIHQAVRADLQGLLGLTEIESYDTAEANETPERVANTYEQRQARS